MCKSLCFDVVNIVDAVNNILHFSVYTNIQKCTFARTMLYIDVYTNYNDIMLVYNDVLRAIHNFYVSTEILINSMSKS